MATSAQVVAFGIEHSLVILLRSGKIELAPNSVLIFNPPTSHQLVYINKIFILEEDILRGGSAVLKWPADWPCSGL